MSESRKKSKMAALALLAFVGSATISAQSVQAAGPSSEANDSASSALNILQSIDTGSVVEKDVAAKIEQAKQLLEESSKKNIEPDGARNPTCA